MRLSPIPPCPCGGGQFVGLRTVSLSKSRLSIRNSYTVCQCIQQMFVVIIVIKVVVPKSQ